MPIKSASHYLSGLLTLIVTVPCGFANTTEVCVRNYSVRDADPCARGLVRYVYTETLEGSLACIMTYEDLNCKHAPDEFDHVTATTGRIVCTVDYHQPPISTMCASYPESFVWVRATYPD